jgi:hypothetical protein
MLPRTFFVLCFTQPLQWEENPEREETSSYREVKPKVLVDPLVEVQFTFQVVSLQ